MGMEVITGSFASSTPWCDISMAQLNEEQSGKSFYNGKFISISSAIKNEGYYQETADNMFKGLSGKKRHEAYTEYVEIIAQEHNNFEKGEICLLADYNTIIGYDIFKVGKREEISLNSVPEDYWYRLDRSKKGYTVVKVGRRQFVGSYREEFTTLAEVDTDERIKRDVLNGSTYFVIKNDLSKAYILKPNKRRVKGSTVKGDGKTVSVKKVYPYYYYANVAR